MGALAEHLGRAIVASAVKLGLQRRLVLTSPSAICRDFLQVIRRYCHISIYGFAGISFDQIVIIGDGSSNDADVLDMLQTKAGAVPVPEPEPEPGMLALLGLAGLGAINAARRRRAA